MRENDEHRYALHGQKLVDAEATSEEGISQLRTASKNGELKCSVCGGVLVPKMGEVLRWHFAHTHDNEYRYHEPESPVHLKAKKMLFKHFRAVKPDWAAATEVRIPETKQIADVLLVTDEDERVALEVQYSNMSAQQWRRRHELYQEAGVHDIWLLGYDRLGKELRGPAKVRSFKPDQLVTALLAEKEQVVYVNPARRELVFLVFPPRVLLAAEKAGVLPRVNVQVHKFPLGEVTLGGDLTFRRKAN